MTASSFHVSSYQPSGITPEDARTLRAKALLYAIECYEQKKSPVADPGGRGEDGTKVKGDSAYAKSIHN